MTAMTDWNKRSKAKMPVNEAEPRLWLSALLGFLAATLTALLRYIYAGKEKSMVRILSGALLSGAAALTAAALVIRYFSINTFELVALSSFLGYLGAETVMMTLYALTRRKLGIPEENGKHGE